MKRLFRSGVSLMFVALCAGMAGCVSPGPATAPAATVTSSRAKTIPAERAGAITIGKSTRPDVIAALGETLTISFDSGFEVWVYRIASDPAKAPPPQGGIRGGGERVDAFTPGEFVVLFAPSGIVAKTRIRPPGNGDARPRP